MAERRVQTKNGSLNATDSQAKDMQAYQTDTRTSPAKRTERLGVQTFDSIILI